MNRKEIDKQLLDEELIKTFKGKIFEKTPCVPPYRYSAMIQHFVEKAVLQREYELEKKFKLKKFKEEIRLKEKFATKAKTYILKNLQLANFEEKKQLEFLLNQLKEV